MAVRSCLPLINSFFEIVSYLFYLLNFSFLSLMFHGENWFFCLKFCFPPSLLFTAFISLPLHYWLHLLNFTFLSLSQLSRWPLFFSEIFFSSLPIHGHHCFCLKFLLLHFTVTIVFVWNFFSHLPFSYLLWIPYRRNFKTHFRIWIRISKIRVRVCFLKMNEDAPGPSSRGMFSVLETLF